MTLAPSAIHYEQVSIADGDHLNRLGYPVDAEVDDGGPGLLIIFKTDKYFKEDKWASLTAEQASVKYNYLEASLLYDSVPAGDMSFELLDIVINAELKCGPPSVWPPDAFERLFEDYLKEQESNADGQE